MLSGITLLLNTEFFWLRCHSAMLLPGFLEDVAALRQLKKGITLLLFMFDSLTPHNLCPKLDLYMGICPVLSGCQVRGLSLTKNI